MLSLVIAYIGTNMMYQGRIHDEVRNILIENAEKVIEIYRTTNADNAHSYMEAFNGTAGTRLQLYNLEGDALLDSKMDVSNSDIETVLAGGISDNLHDRDSHYPIVGIPFQDESEQYALFLTVEPNAVEAEIMDSIHIMYIVILFFGSLLIIFAARYVVHPLIKLTEATKKMAHGNFDVVLPTKRRDEIGILSASFNEMSRELQQFDQMRQEFVANVSHEIQSPLTSISGFSKALKQKQISEEKRISYLNIIEQESDRLSRLGRNLLRLSHLQHSQHQLKLTVFRLDEQLRDVIISSEPQWSVKDLALNIQLEAAVIEADADQLKQVWTNLLNNSIKFTPAHGEISIKASSGYNSISISFADSGMGIPLEERKDIFKPFYKVNRSRDAAVKGNGLGLSIVKQIVDLHHGKIHVSEGPKGGAKFTVVLPVQWNN
ncbi:cell wall metabolism sensor histidine kinase WalK [Planomicrobium sp. CPCC 101110]|uniref:sensor histidine kinase n=1 Tax=Planomicrobium sp. CPCC 101110 TaxID=2599619 RepID=UPI0011B6E63F|nr:HAMP domain-containing sensor histidine kinase [Planomicrobium sp. CPCC 101110]TWT25843.1 HAMP domain-containing histidine kinase [Planomicrobium sp. CPCC 101110]